MASGMASLTLGDLHSITTTGRPFRNSTISGTMWCSVPRMRTLSWQTAMKRLLSRWPKSTNRTVGLFSPVLRFSLTLVFSSSRVKTWRLFCNQAAAREACGELLDHLLHLIVFEPGIDDLELLPQHRQHDHIGEALAEGVSWLLLAVEVDDLPVQARQADREGVSRHDCVRRA